MCYCYDCCVLYCVRLCLIVWLFGYSLQVVLWLFDCLCYGCVLLLVSLIVLVVLLFFLFVVAAYCCLWRLFMLLSLVVANLVCCLFYLVGVELWCLQFMLLGFIVIWLVIQVLCFFYWFCDSVRCCLKFVVTVWLRVCDARLVGLVVLNCCDLVAGLLLFMFLGCVVLIVLQ